MILTQKSRAILFNVHPDLRKVIEHAAEDVSFEFGFIVTDGLRTLKQQELLVAQKASNTMKSRHLTGHAVDLAVTINGQVRWDWPLYTKLGNIIKSAAIAVDVPIEWGGDWKTFKDGPHFQLPVSVYP